MKSCVRASWAVMLTAMLLLAGCSRPTETGSAEKTSSQAAPSSQPAISTPAEPTAAPPTAPASTPPQKEQPKARPVPAARPAAPKPVPAPVQETQQPVPAPPQVKTVPPVAESPVAKVPKISRLTLPAGTLVPIRMVDSVDSKTDQVGQTFRASIDSDIAVENRTIVPKGADARLKLNRVSTAGAIRGKSELELQLDQIVVGKNSYAVVSDVIERVGGAQGTKTARNAAIGGAVGAAVGAIAGGKKGAAIGAGVGAGSGVAVSAITKGEQVVVPSETRLEFRLKEPVEIELRRPLSD
jgi:hypothetical protein